MECAAPGYSATTSASPSSAPTNRAATNAGAEPGAMPAKVSETIRPTVTAGFAKDVEQRSGNGADSPRTGVDQYTRAGQARTRTAAQYPIG